MAGFTSSIRTFVVFNRSRNLTIHISPIPSFIFGMVLYLIDLLFISLLTAVSRARHIQIEQSYSVMRVKQEAQSSPTASTHEQRKRMQGYLRKGQYHIRNKILRIILGIATSPFDSTILKAVGSNPTSLAASRTKTGRIHEQIQRHQRPTTAQILYQCRTRKTTYYESKRDSCCPRSTLAWGIYGKQKSRTPLKVSDIMNS